MKNNSDRNRKVIVFLSCIIVVFLIAVIGSSFVFSGMAYGWYDSVRPAIAPPDWVFGVVWNILFFLIGLSLFFGFIDSKNAFQKRNVILVFSVNLILNALWSYIFFDAHQVLWALYEMVLLWLSIVVMMSVTWNISKRSFWLLVPYLLWVSFAMVLNYSSYLRTLLI